MAAEALVDRLIASGRVPDPLLRAGIRATCAARLRQERRRGADAKEAFVERLRRSPIAEQVELEVKYAGYIARQHDAVERAARMEGYALSAELDYGAVRGLRAEAREKLARFRPLTVGQAGRLAGVTPADVAALLVHAHATTVESR